MCRINTLLLAPAVGELRLPTLVCCWQSGASSSYEQEDGDDWEAVAHQGLPEQDSNRCHHRHARCVFQRRYVAGTLLHASLLCSPQASCPWPLLDLHRHCLMHSQL